MIINTLTFHINYSRCFLAAIEVLYFTCVTPSIFYLGVCNGQRVLYFFIQNCSIKFPQVLRFWEGISLAPQCYVLVNPHDCWVWSQNDLLRSICKEITIFTLSTSSNWCLVHSLNSPFFPLHIGAEPERAKRESRIIRSGPPDRLSTR